MNIRQFFPSSFLVTLLCLLSPHHTNGEDNGLTIDTQDIETADSLTSEIAPVDEVIVVDGFVDTAQCYQNLIEADVNGNDDGKLQADEFVEFAQFQTPTGELDAIEEYRDLPLVMQATFVTLTCLCRDERFGGNSQDVNCCLGVEANIAIVGNEEVSTSQERTRLFATCFLTDKAISSVLGSEAPSSAPTQAPSAEPTPAPTATPTGLPTASPTTAPTSSPTVTPVSPTATPTASPTDSPTVGAPDSGPPVTTAPTTVAPTVEPTTPIVPPTMAPSGLINTEATVIYSISVRDGLSRPIANSEYEPDLVSAMDLLAESVASTMFSTQRRRLQVVVQTPTVVDEYEVTGCTPGLTNSTDRCENIKHSITLVDSAVVSPSILAEYEANVFNAISRGELQANLPLDSVVTILTGREPSTSATAPTPDPEDSGVSAGGIAGIVIAALVVVVLPIAYLSMRRKEDEKEPYGSYQVQDTGSVEGMKGPGSPGDDDEPEIDVEAKGGTATLGAMPSDYGKSKDASIKQVHKVPVVDQEVRDDEVHGQPYQRHANRSMDHDHDSSSNAGSSGWSSSAGLSSLNTGSAEDSMDMLHSPQGASLAAIGAASAVARRMENRKNLSPMTGSGIEDLDVPAGAVSRNDLDNAIEAGDWAAVGATAALLAAASDSQSASSRSRASASRASRSQATSGASSGVDAARAAELDHLVDAGDWEGVVLAAAKFEAQEGSIKSGTASNRSSASAGSVDDTRSGTGSGTFTPSVSTSVSESASKAQKRDEIRQEVEALVKRVVPEELDNVDEMMSQFKGREEELVETLRTMQERAVAQKARTAGHKAAKQEARRTVQRGGMAVPAAGNASVDTSTVEGQSSVAASSSTDTARRKRSALEQAIEDGDWERVGEAAAILSDASLTSTSTAEYERLAAGTRLSRGGTSSRSLGISGVTAERARELDRLIEKSDWAGVVETAGRFNQADKEASSQASAESPFKRPTSSSKGETAESDSKRTKQSKEEEDALAQAEIWMQIAQQSKVEGATDTGASDAADWAIARSLEALKKAEEKGDGGSASGSHQGSKQSGGDDESV